MCLYLIQVLPAYDTVGMVPHSKVLAVVQYQSVLNNGSPGDGVNAVKFYGYIVIE